MTFNDLGSKRTRWPRDGSNDRLRFVFSAAHVTITNSFHSILNASLIDITKDHRT